MLTPQSIDILIPTRERPENMEKVARSVIDSAAEPKNITICFWIDFDDKASLAQEDKIKPWMDEALRESIFLAARRLPLPHAYNEMSQWVNGDIIMYAADDIEFRTQGWDKRVLEEFAKFKDRILLLWCHDPARDERGAPFSDHGFLSRWAKMALKYVFPIFPPRPDQPEDKGISFTDVWLKPLYESLGRTKYLEDVTIAHVHWYAPMSGAGIEIDDSYARHAILSSWRKTGEFSDRIAEMPHHAEMLKKWIRYVEGGGLERLQEQGAFD